MKYQGLLIAAMPYAAVVAARGVLAKEIIAATAHRNRLTEEGKKGTQEYKDAEADLRKLKNTQVSLLLRGTDFRAGESLGSLTQEPKNSKNN